MRIFKVEKVNVITEETFDYGTCCEEDVKLIVKGYHFNGLFYEKKNSNTIYVVTEIN